MSFTPGFQSHESLESIVRSAYTQIQTPDLSLYSQIPLHKVSGLPSAEETICLLCQKSKSNTGDVPGLSSTLYSFQLRSVCKMYEKESMTLRQCVPHFVEFTSPTGSRYFFNTLENTFNSNPELYVVPKGGILAENMGLGKTLICLALICLSKHEISSIPHDIILEEPPKGTDIGSFKMKPLKTLAEIALSSIAQNSLPWKYFAQDLPSAIVQKLKKLPGVFFVSREPVQSNLGLRVRNATALKPSILKLVLTSSTLVIVPENLLHQWNDETKKHVRVEFLRKLFISDRFKNLMHYENGDYMRDPPQDPILLVSYDVVVISAPLFSKLCADPSTVFMKIYWKRLIIDEGHSMSSRSSNLSLSCKLIHAERRWVVTGTPTSGLTNLHVDEGVPEAVTESPKKRRKYTVKGKFNVREDLNKLGNLVSNYFKIEPFYSQPSLWGSSITKNLTNSNQFTAKISLQTLLNSLMVRHTQLQVEADLVLPQLHHEAVSLKPSYQNKLAINLFTSVLAVNAVSSERVGGDYMFDPMNRQQLQKLVSNLQLSTFYWTGFQILDVKSLLNVANSCLEKLTPSGEAYYNPEDRRLLVSSIHAVKEALCNPRWRAAASLHEMQLYVTNLPKPYVDNFAIGSINDIGVFGAPQLHAIQKFFYKNRFISSNDESVLASRLRESSKAFWKDYWVRSEKTQNRKFSKPEAFLEFDAPEEKRKNDVFEKQIICKQSVSTRETDSVALASHSTFKNILDKPYHLKDQINPKRARILGTASSKLSYLASKLTGHQKDGVKSIVFFEYEDSAYYLTELLDVLGIKYILYATFVEVEKRPNNLNDFASHSTETQGGITLIMDLKLASHSLTVIAATRVYFMNPVWQRSVEAQAIKRAHRIGQTKEVFVETLVLRGTLEEEIYRRRIDDGYDLEARDVKGGETFEKKYVIDDTGMQNFVLRHEFLSVDKEVQEHADFSETVVGEDLADNSQDKSILNASNAPQFSLPSHSSDLLAAEGRIHRAWNMRLFSADNLQKFNESRQSKPNLEQLNVEFVEGKHQPTDVHINAGSSRKRVRF
ncbi:hypothetical protein METBIDRAFT_35673 [Metschnikowia bicuspidata var. bicuspidata NRRL YB-4993]|uniref:Helicase C-terminal domain-containing protein n=1 Tax=Metschnikowia bicuspidata var. bicuspidata NRRL YB-4993 TaxID=869754 RepID=A0A1A0HJU4_9ASCO|nr:hypothetical protein METBIDRAFT_35673 [Metschnikowia bicuspidata var. bicuspidata NRRL YB-4993]OBA24290.1 hypothetical protein METBIDRAFT_35673 [Metschnikowia bicuspidata var. bicuspidata NRRL YB-4993]